MLISPAVASLCACAEIIDQHKILTGLNSRQQHSREIRPLVEYSTCTGSD